MWELDCTIKRYFNIILVKPRFLLVAAVIPILFYIYMLSNPVAYEITNTIEFSSENWLDLPGSMHPPLDRGGLLRDPDLLFLDASLLAELDHLITRNRDNPERGLEDLTGFIMEDTSLVPSGENHVQVIYHGARQTTGTLIVLFYSRKLSAHSCFKEDGAMVSSDGKSGVSGIPYLSNNLEVRKIYSFWNRDRLYPMAIMIAVSFLIMMIIVAAVEWMDSSLKTEQQAGNYLNLPVLGTFPDFQEIGAVLGLSNEEQTGKKIPGHDSRP